MLLLNPRQLCVQEFLEKLWLLLGIDPTINSPLYQVQFCTYI